MDAPTRSRRWLLPLAALLFVAAGQGLWLGHDDRQDWLEVYFEPGPQGVQVVVEPPLPPSMVPHVTVGRDGVLDVPPGRAVALPLADGQTWTIGGEGLPLLALGQRQEQGQLRILSGLQTLGEGGVRPLQMDVPWRRQSQEIDALSARFGEADVAVVSAQDGGAIVRWGTGEWGAPEVDHLLLFAGDSWRSVKRGPEEFARVPVLRPEGAAVAGVLAALATALIALGLGAEATLSTGALCAVLGLVGAHLGALGLAVSALVGLIAALGRGLWRLGWKALGPAAALLAIAAAPTHFVGYSTVEGDGLRVDSNTPGPILAARCPAAAPVTVQAEAGGSMDWLSEAVCSPGAIPAGANVLMLGGTNDDYLWGLRAGGAAGRASYWLAGLRTVVAGTTWSDGSVSSFYSGAVDRSLETLPAQVEAYRAAARCAKEGGGRMVLLQNYEVADLRAGRGAGRDELVRARMEAVRSEGGQAVDLLERMGDRASITWFADRIHPTAVGHRHYADEACALLADGAR
jgi:hypothetical protein